ncbi:hypothetical protein ACINK0_18065 (plasmid) [Deinococcus sp. VB343]
MISARIRQEHAAAVDSLVTELKAAGWAVEKYHILEFALRPLLVPDGRDAIIRILSENPPGNGGPPRGVMSSRIRDGYKQTLQDFLVEARGRGLVLEQYHVLELLLSPMLTPESRAEFVERLGQEQRWD